MQSLEAPPVCSFFPWTKSKGDFASYLQGFLPSPPLNPSFKLPQQKYKTIMCVSCHLHRPIPTDRPTEDIKKPRRKLLASRSDEPWVFLVPLPGIWIPLLGKRTFSLEIHVSFFLLLLFLVKFETCTLKLVFLLCCNQQARNHAALSAVSNPLLCSETIVGFRDISNMVFLHD